MVLGRVPYSWYLYCVVGGVPLQFVVGLSELWGVVPLRCVVSCGVLFGGVVSPLRGIMLVAFGVLRGRVSSAWCVAMCCGCVGCGECSPQFVVGWSALRGIVPLGYMVVSMLWCVVLRSSFPAAWYNVGCVWVF